MRVAILVALFAAVASAAPAPAAIPNSHIVILKDDANSQDFHAWFSNQASQRAGRVAGKQFDSVFKGFSGTFDDELLAATKARSDVAMIAPNLIHQISDQQTPSPNWGLPRISSAKPGQTTYLYPSSAGAGVTAYIIDTGVRITHEEFEGTRAKWGFSAIPNVDTDDNGHGTHVASTVAGKTYGVAKKANIVAVKVCTGEGQCTTENIISGIDFAVKDGKGKKAVANMSLGGGVDDALDKAVEKAIAAGIPFALAAGNENADACQSSPARTPNALTVGAITQSDSQADFSNWGACVDVYAPGDQITAAWKDSDTAQKTISGTSMASPHGCGVLALFSAEGNFSPAEIVKQIVDKATNGVITNLGQGSPNKVLFNGGEGDGSANPTSSPVDPTGAPTSAPTDVPTSTDAPVDPTGAPTDVPTDVPTSTGAPVDPTGAPTDVPTGAPTDVPTGAPTDVPTDAPTDAPTDVPTSTGAPVDPTGAPTDPTGSPTDQAPTSPPDNGRH